MTIQFIVRDEFGKTIVDLAARNAVVTDVITHPIDVAQQPNLIKKLGPTSSKVRYWACIEAPNLKGQRSEATLVKPIVNTMLTALIVTKESLKSTSPTYTAIANTLDAGYYYLVVFDERLTGMKYATPVIITIGTY